MGTEPLWAVLTGILLAGEPLGPLTATGAACLLVGTAWGQRVEFRHRTVAFRAHLPAGTSDLDSAGATATART
jgi:hypothetical protein